MLWTLRLGCLILGLTGIMDAAQLQGVVVDWACVKPMVHEGREKVLKNNRRCSLLKNYNRGSYGLITEDLKYYRLQDPGDKKIKQLLKDTPDKDNLKVVVTGDIQGGTIKVVTISEL